MDYVNIREHFANLEKKTYIDTPKEYMKPRIPNYYPQITFSDFLLYRINSEDRFFIFDLFITTVLGNKRILRFADTNIVNAF